MKTIHKLKVPSVNYHLWEPCNFRCKFCFATFKDVRKTILPKGHLPKEEAIQLIDQLAEAGFTKITFVGGEPTLCPWIGDLVVRAKTKGFTTMMVSNGSGFNKDFFLDVKGFLDWAVLSIDSLSPEINRKTGRAGTNLIPDREFYQSKASLISDFGVRLKVNTVVNRNNFQDMELSSFLKEVKPERWKIFKALQVKGQNDACFSEMEISDEEWKLYLVINRIHKLNFAVPENNDEMTGSYVMIDPAGRFFDNTKGFHTYSSPILQTGVNQSLSEIHVDSLKFIERGGMYNWQQNKIIQIKGIS